MVVLVLSQLLFCDVRPLFEHVFAVRPLLHDSGRTLLAVFFCNALRIIPQSTKKHGEDVGVTICVTLPDCRSLMVACCYLSMSLKESWTVQVQVVLTVAAGSSCVAPLLLLVLQDLYRVLDEGMQGYKRFWFANCCQKIRGVIMRIG